MINFIVLTVTIYPNVVVFYAFIAIAITITSTISIFITVTVLLVVVTTNNIVSVECVLLYRLDGKGNQNLA